MKKVTKDLEKLGIVNVAQVYRNLTPAELVEHALKREEAHIVSKWSFSCNDREIYGTFTQG